MRNQKWAPGPPRRGQVPGQRAADVERGRFPGRRTPAQKGHSDPESRNPESERARVMKNEEQMEPEHVKRLSASLKSKRNANCSYSENTVFFIFQIGQSPQSLVAHSWCGRAFEQAPQAVCWREQKWAPVQRG